MDKDIRLTIDGNEVIVKEGATVLEAARKADIYVPALCYHPDLPPYGACRLCICEIEGMRGYPTSCTVPATDGMKVSTNTDKLQELRREVLTLLMEGHPHACLNCAQREGCTREPCSTSVPVEERCCPKFGNCELQRVVEYIGIREDTPKYVPKGAKVFNNEPLVHRDYNLCILCGRCVSACNDLRGIGVLGFIERGHEAQVRTAFDMPLVNSDCMFCTTCIEVCPTGALRDKDLDKGAREDVLVPCRNTCPASVDIPRFIHHILKGHIDDAAAVLWESLPIPGVLGHICFHPCEDRCKRGKVNEPISIRELQRFAATSSSGDWRPEVDRVSTGKKVAIVGSGPAGLSAAYFLAIKGHEVTVLEAEDSLGGMLRWAIPEYRLPRDLLDAEIGVIANQGVEFRTGTRVGSVKDLKDQGYDAVLVATGASKGKSLGVDGEASRNVMDGLDFIKLYNTGNPSSLGEKVVIVGGTSLALEAARICRRIGTTEVDILVPPGASPLHPEELDLAKAEGVRFHHDIKVTSIDTGTDPNIPSLIVRTDGDGRSFEVHGVIKALGSEPEPPEGLGPDWAFKAGEAADPGIPAVEAVAKGRKAAEEMDRFLGGNGDLTVTLLASEAPDPKIGRIKGFARLPRVRADVMPVEKRLKDLGLECPGLDKDQAHSEASRCLRCDLRLTLSKVPSPPEKLMALTEENVAKVPGAEGVYTLMDGDKNVLAIKGVDDLAQALKAFLDEPGKVAFFDFEEDKMFSKRENELLQQYMQVHGKMPEGAGGDDDLDDLF
jgi:NADPH-dependent glutamate synthase beta subunit-like oxidoreductase